ncbi:MAG: hypothetical protein JO199_01225 [Candidatus Eremiobacteraeota bacterium]|nr:hypothetical protein [Candidatus Eremiobacteraeota bacterium]
MISEPEGDRYKWERFAFSLTASFVVHALLALLLFTVLVGSTEEGATENVYGGEVVSIERASPVQLPQPAPSRNALPVPHAPRVAPLRHAPLAQPQAQRLPQNFHELARQMPSAPPNPKPIPQQSLQPNPQPTSNVFEVQPQNQTAAVPTSLPSLSPVSIATKPPPTAVPSPAPTAPPARTPATPAPVAPSPKPAATAVARATPAPSATPAPVARVSAAPSSQPGVPSPSPTRAESPARTAGSAPSPGPKSRQSPGPGQASTPGTPAPARPVELRPTPVPPPTPRPLPPHSPGVDINARLRAMLPSGPVTPSTKQYAPRSYSLRGHLEPTPPPEVLAATKYFYDAKGSGNEREVKMWVTNVRRAGPLTICTGWLVRYPMPVAGNYAPVPSNDNIAPANGAQVSIGGGHGGGGAPSPFYAGEAPIVEGMVSQPCEHYLLVPFAASPAPSP